MKKHITIKLFAGLGNQIFQYSYGQYLKKQGYKVSYILNRSFNQDGLCTDFPGIFTLPEYLKKAIFMPSSFCKKFRLVIHKAIAKYFLHDYSTGYYQKSEYVADFTGNYYHFTRENDYKQTEAYKNIIDCESVFIHIRGGDYHNESQYDNICTAEYYSNAISKIKQKIQNPHFFIFTNDTEYAKKLISSALSIAIKDEFTFVCDLPSPTLLSRDPGFDLYLMSKCKHAIIANSTYSWWGAFMQNRKITNHLVIFPTVWSKTEPSKINELIPSIWTKK